MFRCIVELYGLSRDITELREVELELEDGASLRDVIAALKRKIPALEGLVIRRGEDRLTEYYAFNVNGRFYFHDGNTQLKSGDHVALLTLATGG
jgi:molybdopterin converting factor small subunit